VFQFGVFLCYLCIGLPVFLTYVVGAPGWAMAVVVAVIMAAGLGLMKLGDDY